MHNMYLDRFRLWYSLNMGARIGSELHPNVGWYDTEPIWMMVIDPDDINGIEELCEDLRDYFNGEHEQPWQLQEATFVMNNDEVRGITMLP